MLPTILSYTSYGLEFVGMLIGLARYRVLPTAWKWVLLVLCAAFVTEGLAKVIVAVSPNPNTLWLYNLYMLVDGTAMAVAALLLLKNRWAYLAGTIGIAGCYGIWIYQWTQLPLTVLYTTAFVAQSLLLTALYLLLPIRAALAEKLTLRRSDVLLCLANVIYSGCNIPRMALYHYVMDSDSGYFFAYVLPITSVLSVVRYTFILAGLLSLPRLSSAHNAPAPL